MKKLLKPASIAFYFLFAIIFFFLGMYLAKITGAAKGQGLAGGAIVFGWGIMFGGIAFIASFFIARFVVHKWIVRLNWILLVIIAIVYGLAHYSYLERQKEKEKENSEHNFGPPSTTPTTASDGYGGRQTTDLAMLSKTEAKSKAPTEKPTKVDGMGMGFFSPNYYEDPTLYFYGNMTPGKSLMEHAPQDSVTFKRNKYNQFEIATAPPWLVANYAKLDYDFLYFKVISVSQETLEVVVNETNGQTAYVDRRAGNFSYWPDFLLGVHSVEFLPQSNEKVKVKPLNHAGENNAPHQFMRPLKIKGNWMHVALWNSDFKEVGRGWIQWKRDGKLLILYNMLS